MAYRVILKRSAEKELDALQANLRDRIIKRLLALEENPRPSGIKDYKGKKVIVCVLGITECYTLSMTK